MHRHIVTAAALLAIGNSAHAEFQFQSAIVVPGSVIEPSVGSFRTQYALPDAEGAFLNNRVSVDNSRAIWRNNFDEVMTSTWLAIDSYGPKGPDGTEAYGTGWFTKLAGPGSPVAVPTYNHALASDQSGLAINGNLGDPVNGDGLSPGFYGNQHGMVWSSFTEETGARAPSAITAINGVDYDSVYLGHFVLSNPLAELVGDDLLISFRLKPQDSTTHYLLPLNGDKGQTASHDAIPLGGATAFRLEYERTTFTNSLGTFTALDMYLVPAPATAIPLLALLPALRRRRPTQ